MFSYRELTERLAQYGECDHYDETKQFSPGFLKQTQNSDLRKTPLVINFKSLGCSSRSGCRTSFAFSFSGASRRYFSTTTRLISSRHRYSTCPTSTTLDIRTPVQQDGSTTSDDSTLCTPNHLSDVSRASFHLTTTASYPFLRSTKVASKPSGSPFAQGSQVDWSRMEPATLTAETSKLIPLSLKKSRWVKRGERTKLCTQAIDVSTIRRLKGIPFKLTVNTGNSSSESRRNRVVI